MSDTLPNPDVMVRPRGATILFTMLTVAAEDWYVREQADRPRLDHSILVPDRDLPAVHASAARAGLVVSYFHDRRSDG